LVNAKIGPNENTASFGERISALLNCTVKVLADEPALKNSAISGFLSHMAEVFFAEQGNQNIAQYLELYCKGFSRLSKGCP